MPTCSPWIILLKYTAYPTAHRIDFQMKNKMVKGSTECDIVDVTTVY